MKLKHLAPYLPYSVKCSYDCLDIYGQNWERYKGTLWLHTFKELQVGSIKNLQLHLRPLSDLTKEIEHNGERFVPVQKLKQGDIINLELIDMRDLIAAPKELPFIVIEKLFEWHFDVFNGIGDWALNMNEV